MARTRWWHRFTRGRGAGDEVEISKEDLAVTLGYLDNFVASRQGVEVWVEAPTNFNRPSIVLIAYDGEWTRRVVPSTQWGHQFAEERQLASYDAGVVSYPQRMRDWNQRSKD